MNIFQLLHIINSHHIFATITIFLKIQFGNSDLFIFSGCEQGHEILILRNYLNAINIIFLFQKNKCKMNIENIKCYCHDNFISVSTLLTNSSFNFGFA